ncbi:Dolichyl-diphosphooligosaccharide-protein glycosyltransferase subunit dad1 [Sporothrix epigloea]|uniref:DASH complex subunit DAD1 n=1 Tax=Sporothrix epigloea TaxID=1892477 RepID=A0ABP0DZY1_9PEZI
MAGTRPAGASTFTAARKSFFEQQRELLLVDISTSFEQVLANINKLNRSLEAVVTVGNEFSAVEALWSQFEGVMAKEPDSEAAGGENGEGGEGGDDELEQHGEDQYGDNGDAPGLKEDHKDAEAATRLHNEEAATATGNRKRWKEEDMDIGY